MPSVHIIEMGAVIFIFQNAHDVNLTARKELNHENTHLD